MTDRRTAYEWRTLLAERIKESGLRTAPFARDVLIREPRTVRRWLSADSPIPNRVKEWLQGPTVAPWPASTAITTLRDRMQDTGVCDVCGSDQSKEE